MVIGVLSALPVLNIANCCCAWILFGGALAAYLMQQSRPEPIGAADGAVVGLMAGAIGAVVWLILTIPISAAMAPLQSQMMQRALRNASSMPPEARVFLEGLSAGPASGLSLVFSFFVMLCLSSVFAMFGGLFGALMFRKPAAPPPPPPPPTTNWMPPPIPDEER